MQKAGRKSKSDELAAMAEARSKEKGISYDLALREIVHEDPVLTAEARKEVLCNELPSATIAGPTKKAVITAAEIGNRLAEMIGVRSKEKGISFYAALLEIGGEFPSLTHGSHGFNEALAAMAETRSKERGIDYALALSEVARENRDLERAAREETIRGKGNR